MSIASAAWSAVDEIVGGGTDDSFCRDNTIIVNNFNSFPNSNFLAKNEENNPSYPHYFDTTIISFHYLQINCDGIS